MSGAMAAGLYSCQGTAPVGIEPYFPSAAHQLVWRNWDLVPVDRIAKAAGCTTGAVERIATTMRLGRQEIAPPTPRVFGSGSSNATGILCRIRNSARSLRCRGSRSMNFCIRMLSA